VVYRTGGTMPKVRQYRDKTDSTRAKAVRHYNHMVRSGIQKKVAQLRVKISFGVSRSALYEYIAGREV